MLLSKTPDDEDRQEEIAVSLSWPTHMKAVCGYRHVISVLPSEGVLVISVVCNLPTKQ